MRSFLSKYLANFLERCAMAEYLASIFGTEKDKFVLFWFHVKNVIQFFCK